MKLLFNICSHDGIISHYNGVGSMTRRYIECITSLKGHDVSLNLFTPLYLESSFGYNNSVKKTHESLCANIYTISNGSSGSINYGGIDCWKELSRNTANVINNLDISEYDLVITICNDTPYAGVVGLIDSCKKHKVIWIPHSTVKIHEVDSAIIDSHLFYDVRLHWEQSCIDYVNSHDNCYIGTIGKFITKHLVTEYSLDFNKTIDIYNGELIGHVNTSFSKSCETLIKDFENEPVIILSFGRAEPYKNLEATMKLGNEMNIRTIVIAQSYYKEQEILNEYKKLATEMGTDLYIDAPFDFGKYILNNYQGKIIMVIPSLKEIMGLIINEVRILNKSSILVVANNIPGINEQIEDEVDGVLVDLNDITNSSNKIKKMLKDDISILNKNGYMRVCRDYNIKHNMNMFLERLGVINE